MSNIDDDDDDDEMDEDIEETQFIQSTCTCTCTCAICTTLNEIGTKWNTWHPAEGMLLKLLLKVRIRIK
jgi:hypothetical protein